jgi:DNA modification methylase
VSAGDPVNIIKKSIPLDYHCHCDYCKKYLGELRLANGNYYSRLERRQYYTKEERGESGHIAKSPLHIARWSVQQYTKPGQWVIDPTIGAGTTAVEALTQGRNAAGMELQYGDILEANVKKHLGSSKAMIRVGDAREIGAFLKEKLPRQKFHLVVNNPPYSGDESMPSAAEGKRGKEFRHLETVYKYKDDLPNLAFLKEADEYWGVIAKIYGECARVLAPGGHFVIGVKDMIKNKEPFLLHKMYADVLCNTIGLKFVGTAILRHYPATLFLNSYFKMRGVHPPYYQSICVFKKEK